MFAANPALKEQLDAVAQRNMNDPSSLYSLGSGLDALAASISSIGGQSVTATDLLGYLQATRSQRPPTLQWLKIDSQPATSQTKPPELNWADPNVQALIEATPEQQQKFIAFANEHAAIQKRVAQKMGVEQPFRGQHAKGVGLSATFEVYDNIPEYAKAGLFANGGKFKGVARFSGSAGVPDKETAPDARGFAIAFIGPDGKEQNFLMTNREGFFKNADEVMVMVRAKMAGGMAKEKYLAEHPGDLAGAENALKGATMATAVKGMVTAGIVGTEAEAVQRAGFLFTRSAADAQRPVQSYLTETYISNMPIKVGNRVARFAVRPLTSDGLNKGTADKPLTADLTNRLAKEDAEFEFGLQFYESPDTTPLNDATNPWATPFVPVGRVTLPKQDLTSAESQALAKQIDDTSFSPWNTSEHTPVGDIGLARKPIYETSAGVRNACPYGF
ncbi:MAG: catalase [Myxococcaceae bacterium]|nr:catalase [Myxococcaceae bacterium]